MNYWVRYMMYRHRYRLARFYRATLLYGLVLLLFLALYQVSAGQVVVKTIKGGSLSLFDIALNWGERDPRGLLRSAAPVIAWAGNREDYPELITLRSLVSAASGPFRFNLASPQELLASEMPALAEFRRNFAQPAGSSSVPTIEAIGSAPPGLGPDALLGVYFTHTGENYALTDGIERKEGERGGVVEVGKALKEKLEKEHGIRVALDDRVNDGNYQLSYVESEKTARRLLGGNPGLLVLLDIHRDAGKTRAESLVRVGGKEMAPILLIVGSDARSPFPTWRDNQSFALKLSEKINRKYPGLCLGVRVKEGRYNQFLHPRALLVEMGTVNNSTAEAVQSAGLLAGILAGEIAELAPQRAAVKQGDNTAPGGSKAAVQ